MKQQILKNIISKKRKAQIVFCIFISVVLIIAACTAVIDSVVQPDTVNAGDSAHFEMHIEWILTNFDRTDRLVVGVCMPKSWHGDDNTTMNMVSSVGNGTMSKIPGDNIEPTTGLPWKDAFLQKFGIGPNLIDDVEWVVFWTDQAYFVPNQTNPFGTVFISVKTSTDNLLYKPGYAFCEDVDGLSDFFVGYYANTWGNCMQVLNGTGDVEDFCNPQIGVAEPSNATKNDILTFKYDGNVDSSQLKNENEIYFCSTAYTSDGQIIQSCSQEDKSKMIMYDAKKWRIDMWPLKYYSLTSEQELTKIEYYFTDKTGSIKVGFANTDAPFKYTFKCN